MFLEEALIYTIIHNSSDLERASPSYEPQDSCCNRGIVPKKCRTAQQGTRIIYLEMEVQ
jgi:hypothetical protein